MTDHQQLNDRGASTPRRHRWASLLAGLALVAAMLVIPAATAPPAEAAVTVWYGTVDTVLDGDTFEVDWNSGYEHPQGKTRIRVLGVDTNETAGSECLAAEATTALQALLPPGTPVRLEARDLNSETLGRPLRHVFVGPGWNTNVALELIEDGLGLPASYDIEPDYRDDYFTAGEQAMVDGVGMWAAGACGSIAGEPSLEMLVNYDAAGNDANNLNDEYIQIRNTGSTSLSLSGWSVRSSARLDGTTEMLGGSVPPGGRMRIHVGSGTNTSTDRYLGYSEAWFDNVGDVLYLRDEDLNMRAAQFWPCTVTCGELSALVIEDVQYNAPGNDATNPNGEWLSVRNVSGSTIDLTDWRIKDDGDDYAFADGETLAAGDALTIHIGQGSDSGSTRYWGQSSGILNNTSGVQRLEVRSPHSIEVDCYAWGNSSCTTEDIRGAIEFTANYNASGNDTTNPNGEWVALENTSDKSISLAGYDVHTPGHTYNFPSGTTLGAGKLLRLKVGSGTNTSSTHYWGKSSGILNNSGDHVQFRDPSNQVLLEHGWPCGDDCGPERGLVIDHVNYNAPGNDATNPNGEWIRIRNASASPQNLRNWKIAVGPYQLVSVASRPMDPGETITVYIGSGSNSSTRMYWGKSSGILYNSGSRNVQLLSPQRELVGCYSWGSATCPNQSVGASVDLSANYDAVGSDSSNPNGEWVNITNNGSAAIDLDPYHLYTDGTSYHFDGGDTLAPGARIRVRLGNGTDSGSFRYANGSLNALANGGDEVELRRNDTGAVVADVSWPCGSSCPNAPAFRITDVNPDAPGSDATNPNGEWIEITNTGSSSANLRDWRIQYKTGTFFDVDNSVVVPAGGTVLVRMGSGSDTSTTLYWGNSSGLLSNSSGSLKLWSPHREVVDTETW